MYVRSALFLVVTQYVVVNTHRRFGTTLSRNVSKDLPLRAAVTTRKSADLIYIAAEAWNQIYTWDIL